MLGNSKEIPNALEILESTAQIDSWYPIPFHKSDSDIFVSIFAGTVLTVFSEAENWPH